MTALNKMDERLTKNPVTQYTLRAVLGKFGIRSSRGTVGSKRRGWRPGDFETAIQSYPPPSNGEQEGGESIRSIGPIRPKPIEVAPDTARNYPNAGGNFGRFNGVASGPDGPDGPDDLGPLALPLASPSHEEF